MVLTESPLLQGADRMSIDITAYTEAINSALAEGSFCVVATNGADGIPDIGFKGSMQVVDSDHVSYWERVHGQHLTNLRQGGGVAILYFNRNRGLHLRLFGRAELYEEGP